MSKYEDHIVDILNKEKISFVREKTYNDLRMGKFRYDFFLPTQKILIEVDGEYHFKPIAGRQAMLKGQENDRRKNSYALSNKIPLYRIPFWDIKKIKSFDEMMRPQYRVKDRWHNDKIWSQYCRDK